MDRNTWPHRTNPPKPPRNPQNRPLRSRTRRRRKKIPRRGPSGGRQARCSLRRMPWRGHGQPCRAAGGWGAERDNGPEPQCEMRRAHARRAR
eukprot:4917400-Alexandrium_andersonii.AAC.1